MTKNDASTATYTAFVGDRRVAAGTLAAVAQAVRTCLDDEALAALLIFDDATSQPVELDLRGSPADVDGRLAAQAGTAPIEDEKRGPGRPRLGVVSREISLLPRHWDWLAGQPGGASVTLRRLVDEARKARGGRDRVRRAQEAAHRFMTAMVGDRVGFEEALRALYAADAGKFAELSGRWPPDLRTHIQKLAAAAFPAF